VGIIVVGRPAGGAPGGRPGRVVAPRGVWPVPPEWLEHPSRWGCDSVSFYVAGDGGWRHGSWCGDEIFHDGFRMQKCGDDFYRNVYFDGGSFTINIECVESRDGDPTEVVGRLFRNGGRDSGTIFRVDVEGQHGERPARGRTYAAYVGPVRIEVEIDDFAIGGSTTRWSPERIDWIRFDVRAFADR
jgi:hypothetical protein